MGEKETKGGRRPAKCPAKADGKTASWKSKLVDRGYGKAVLGDWLFVPAYVAFVAAVLAAIWMTGGVDPFSRVETVASTAVGFLGLFIALWLVIHERNKRITENHFYKVQILWHVQKMLDIASSHFSMGAAINIGAVQKSQNISTEEAVKNLRNDSASDYLHHKNQVEALNNNTYVPADIRHRVLRLVRTAGSPLRNHPRIEKQWNIISVENDILKPLDLLIGSEYFTRDVGVDVGGQLAEVDASRRSVKEHLDSWKGAEAAAKNPWRFHDLETGNA